MYSQTFNKKDSLTESFYVNMDTLFQIVDAELYSQLIHLKDNSEYAYLDDRTYEEMYRDARACVDLCHRDGVIKDEVARDPGKYVVKDPNLVPMLKQVREREREREVLRACGVRPVLYDWVAPLPPHPHPHLPR